MDNLENSQRCLHFNIQALTTHTHTNGIFSPVNKIKYLLFIYL